MMKNFPSQQMVTFIVLFVLLLVRFPIADFVLLLEKILPSFFSIDLDSFRLLQNQFVQLFWRYSYVFIVVVMIANRDRLDKMNLDKGFVLIFLCGGLAYYRNPDWYYSDWKLGLGILIMSLFVFVLAMKGIFNFEKKESNITGGLAIMVVFFLGELLAGSYFNSAKIDWVIYGFLDDIPIVIVEEVMFRGILWMFLKKLSFSDIKIVFLQAALFWLYHIHIANSLAFFWIITPITSILLGLIVWKSKSITSSVIFHLLVNVLSSLVQARNL